MKDLEKNGNVKLPDEYINWIKDIEQLIEIAKLRTAINVHFSLI